MTLSGHSEKCTCERCWNSRCGGEPPAEKPLPVTRAEHLAALDRAFNAGVAAERARVAREKAEARA